MEGQTPPFRIFITTVTTTMPEKVGAKFSEKQHRIERGSVKQIAYELIRLIQVNSSSKKHVCFFSHPAPSQYSSDLEWCPKIFCKKAFRWYWDGAIFQKVPHCFKYCNSIACPWCGLGLLSYLVPVPASTAS